MSIKTELHPFAEYDRQLEREYQERVKSGQEEREMAAFLVRSAAENERMRRNGCIQDEEE